jgi:hypothetical protein
LFRCIIHNCIDFQAVLGEKSIGTARSPVDLKLGTKELVKMGKNPSVWGRTRKKTGNSRASAADSGVSRRPALWQPSKAKLLATARGFAPAAQ